ncbi:DUF5916 domain-containing protein [Longimicrobium sp.]|jgi:hypothetical protein|uniref:DUF5916 domain-containing protein n=1 Tax=Longimicrobium sp. TaxID=2029185 RepID=UPI002F93BD42
MITTLLLAGAALFGPAAAPADTTPAKTVGAHRLAAGQAPTVDGRLDDAVWATVPAATDFVQQYPNPSQPSSQRTEARVAYDDQAVYVAMRAWDTAPDSIAAQLARRDASGIYSDWLHVMFDSYHDRRSAYRFAVNPRGVKKDVFHFDDGSEDLGWDAVWDVEVSVDSAGWSAEFRIPLSQLRFRASDAGQSWGLNLSRDLARKEERSWWSPMLPDQPGFVSRIGTLTGISGLRPPRRLEVLPYTVASVTSASSYGREGDPFFRENAPFASAGADIKYGLSSNLTLTATINPDFGQVEADPSEVNLSAFESFFSEKRPFFVEGIDIFRFGLGLGDDESETLFYSRRIGRQPQRGLSTDDDRPYVDEPQQTTILGAAKLTGKLGDNLSVGVLGALTAEEQARFVTTAEPGEVQRATSEPMSGYGMVRLRRDFNQGRSAFGGVVTGTYRDLSDDALLFLPSSAFSGGLDFRHRFGGGDWETNGWAILTRVNGDTLAIQRLQQSPARYYQRPDASHVDVQNDLTALTGNGASFHVGKIAGRYRGGFLGLYRSPGMEVNDLGFLREADQLVGAGYGRWFQNTPQGPFRNWNLGWNLFSGWTTGNERMFTGANINGSYTLKNLWGGHGSVGRNHGGMNVRGLRGGPALVDEGAWMASASLRTDSRRRMSYSAAAGFYNEDDTGMGHRWVETSINARPSSRVTVSLSPSLSMANDQVQYITQEESGRYVFGRLDQTTVAVTTRLNYTFSPELSLQLYAQPFVSAGDYGDFLQVADPAAADFDERFEPGAAPDFNPEFNVQAFRSNAVLRWEYRPGSTLFVVWSQGRENFVNDGSFGLTRDFGRLFGTDENMPVPATNVLMIKLNYWLNL